MLSLLPSFINERFKQLEARSCLPENEKKVAMLPREYSRPERVATTQLLPLHQLKRAATRSNKASAAAFAHAAAAATYAYV
jgi:hypothetical protein